MSHSSMKTLLWKIFIAAFVFVSFAVTAQEDDYSTVKDASIELTATVQSSEDATVKVRITNKDVLAELNATGVFTFADDSKLLLRSVNSGIPFFVVRESVSNEVATIDVSDYLTVTEPDDAVHSRNSMVNWGIWNVTLQGGPGTDFTFWGLTTLYTGTISTGTNGNLLRTVKLNSIGSGTGHIGGANAQFSGKVIANHGRLDL